MLLQDCLEQRSPTGKTWEHLQEKGFMKSRLEISTEKHKHNAEQHLLNSSICWEENSFQKGVGSTVFSQTMEKVKASLSLALWFLCTFCILMPNNHLSAENKGSYNKHLAFNSSCADECVAVELCVHALPSEIHYRQTVMHVTSHQGCMSICFGLKWKTSGNPEYATTMHWEGKIPGVTVWLDVTNRKWDLMEQVRSEVLRTPDNKITFL